MSLNLVGLPRGVSLSASLAEFYMQDFDQVASKNYDSIFYARYVDDIILIRPPLEEFRLFKRKLQKELPKGLIFNQKPKNVKLSEFDKKAQIGLDNRFDFLGYEFSIDKIHRDADALSRTVKLDISRKKATRMKSRICLAFLRYLKDGNLEYLRYRIRVLAYNSKISGGPNTKKLYSGNCYSYNLIDIPSPSLEEVNKFYRGMILMKSGSLSGRLDMALAAAQKRELLNICFVAGFGNKIHFNYDLETFESLNQGWAYES